MLVDLKSVGIDRSKTGLYAAPGDEDRAELPAQSVILFAGGPARDRFEF